MVNYAKQQRQKDKEREAAEQAKRAEQAKSGVVVADATAAPITPKPSTASPNLGAGILPAGGQAARPSQGTPQQERARFALERIKVFAEHTWKDKPKEQKEFNSHASAMPFMIRANGLGQTAAFYRRKGTDHLYFQLYKLLGDWLAEPNQPFERQPDLLTAITQSDQDAYLAAQIEALLFLDWVKKLASAFLAREEDDGATAGEAAS
jgi:CRISPR type III-B/RAMP module-associated protein Cmr5